MATTTKATSKPRKAPAHPNYSVMVTEAIGTLKERTGSSRQAIVKYIESKYKVGDAGKRQINAALKKGIQKGSLVSPKGHGGSYRLTAKPKTEKKSSIKKASKKASAKKMSKKTKKPTITKKASAVKKTAGKTGVKKPMVKKVAKKPTKKTLKKSGKTA